MIFAVLDYISYRFRRGAYSDERIQAEGGSLATKENFPHPARFRPGDIVFLHTADSFLSWTVMYYTSSVWSHTATVTTDGNIVDATTGVVIEHPLDDYLDGRSYLMVKTFTDEVADEQRLGMVEFCREQIGCGFNWPGIRRMFRRTVLGLHAGYREHFSIDFLVLSLALSPVALFSKSAGISLLALVLAYLLIVAIATPIRWRMHRILAEDGVMLPHCPRHIRNRKCITRRRS